MIINCSIQSVIFKNDHILKLILVINKKSMLYDNEMLIESYNTDSK